MSEAFLIGPFPSGQYGVTDDGVRFYSVHGSRDVAARYCVALTRERRVELYRADGFKAAEPRALVVVAVAPESWLTSVPLDERLVPLTWEAQQAVA